MDRIKESRLPKEYLICIICSKIVKNPKVCTICGEIACLSCIEPFLNSNSKCFFSECESKSLTIIDPMKNLYKLMLGTKIECDNVKYGCSLIVSYENLKKHEENECLFREINCENKLCKEKLRYNELENHIENNCNFRKINCKNEGCNEKYVFCDEENHYLECKFIPKCSHNCLYCSINKRKFEINETNMSKKLNEQIDKITQLENSNNNLETDIKKLEISNLEFKEQINKIEKQKNILQNDFKELINKTENEKNNLQNEIKNLKILMEEIESKNILKSSKPQNLNLLENSNTFDIDFSKSYYTFSENNTKAQWANQSNVPGIADFQYYPVARVNKLFNQNFQVKFIMKGYGWFGIGSKNVSCEGFPGYTSEGWVIRNSDGGMYHNNNQILYNLFSCDGKETTLSYSHNDSTLTAVCENQIAKYKFEFPKEVYFVVSVKSGTSIQLI